MNDSDALGAPGAAAAAAVIPAAVEPPADLPGWFHRFAAGAWHVPGGALFLLRCPRLWLLAAPSSLLGLAGLAGGLILGVYGVRGVEMTIGAHRPRLPDLLDLLSVLGLWTGTLASGILGALAIVLLVSAPLLDRLGRCAEAAAGRAAAPPWAGRDALLALRHSLYLPLAVPLGFLLCLLPFAGPLVAGVFIAIVLAFQLTASPLTRRGRDLAAMRRWHRYWRAETLGFGVAAIVLLPFLSPILAPALVVGASLLVREIEGDAAGVGG